MISTATLVQAIISGIAMGLIYSLVGIEYTLIWNTTGMLNFAHGKVITFCGYLFGALCIKQLGLPLVWSIILALVLAAVLALLMSSSIFIPLRTKDNLCCILATVMAGKILYEAMRLIWGAFNVGIDNYFPGTINIFGAVLPATYIYVVAIAFIMVVAIQLFLNKTKIGKGMKCVSQNKNAASLMGINVTKYMRIAAILSFIVCCFLSILLIPLITLSKEMAEMIALKGFAAGIVGGFGLIPGCTVGGIILGVVENLACIVIPSGYKDVVAFVLLIGFLLIKPSGILGKKAK